MVTYKLYPSGEGNLIKVQVNLVENILFGPKRLTAKTLLSGIPLSRNDRLYFHDFLEDYSEVEVLAHRTILVFWCMPQGPLNYRVGDVVFIPMFFKVTVFDEVPKGGIQ